MRDLMTDYDTTGGINDAGAIDERAVMAKLS